MSKKDNWYRGFCKTHGKGFDTVCPFCFDELEQELEEWTSLKNDPDGYLAKKLKELERYREFINKLKYRVADSWGVIPAAYRNMIKEFEGD